MTHDRRLTPATERVALESLRGVLERPEYTSGRPARLSAPLADLLNAPDGHRDRQVIFGADLTVIEIRGGWAFVQTAQDGYCGWLPEKVLGTGTAPITHRVTAPASHLYSAPDMKQSEFCGLSIGARLSVAGTRSGFAQLATGGFVPLQHIGDKPSTDPVTTAESLLGAPYLWGGNSYAGLDCSGLIQIALLDCGIPCPGDSDLQRDAFPTVSGIARGDLLFWPGHVAMAVSADVMIHATAWKMAVIREGIQDAIARIDAAGEGPFLGIRRPG
ncbi:C40 family peptidase [Paracoccus onubensis]|uniref:NLP/P60 hydrolase n=1 Tax=Paracoccus onubensis TaxID=1675788 RepID=A0A418T8H2_9RHOB|nr:NlpC/P60 family protein [Paracoccus onubensis]RJE89426.1 NLP/P60 hydrolase [Paracoccus onubensis]